MARRRTRNLRYGLLALVISTVLWAMAHGSASVERGYDVPIAFAELADDLVITAQSVDEINIRVLGSPASLRNLSPSKLEYKVNVSGVLLRSIEGRGGDELRHDRLAQAAGAFQRRSRFSGGSLLLGRVEEDRRAILSAEVRALPVELGRVMNRPEPWIHSRL